MPRTREAGQQVHSGRQHRGADGGKAIVAGNERVIRARLSDAKFFYETDLKTQAGRPAAEVQAHRLSREARHAGRAHCAHRAAGGRYRAARSVPMWQKAKRAARLCKADLLTEVVGEFPELQGADGQILRGSAGRGRSRRRMPARITTSRRGRTISCRPIRSRSPSRSPTRSTRWSASGRSTRSRRGAKTRMRCAARPLGVIRLILQNGLRLRLTPQFTNHRRVIAGLDPAIHASAAHDRTTKMGLPGPAR